MNIFKKEVSDRIKTGSSVSPIIHLTVIVLFYTVLSSLFAYAYRFSMNPDGVSYLRLAGYIAEGNFNQSVTGYWGPLITWLVAPFLFFGLDGLVSSRVIMACNGLGLVIGSWFMAERFNLSRDVKLFTTLIAALLAADFTVSSYMLSGSSKITIKGGMNPDILLASLLLFYLYTVTDPDILRRKKTACFCGLWGGIAYLAKHYAFPFFIIHFPLMLFIRAYLLKGDRRNLLKKVLVQAVIGATSFLIVVSPWVLLISSKYDHLTFGTVGRIAHSIMGPDNILHPTYNGLNKPNSYAVTTWEDPSEMEYATWSPFENEKNFKHQLALIKRNIIGIFNYLIFDSPFVSLPFTIGAFLFVLIALFLNILNDKKKFLYCWTFITLIIYCSGFVFVFASASRYYYFPIIITLLLHFHFFEQIKAELRKIGAETYCDWKRNFLISVIFCVFLLAFIIKPGTHFIEAVKEITVKNQVNTNKIIADKLKAFDLTRYYAIIRQNEKSFKDLCIAYYMEKQFLGRPLSKEVENFTQELLDEDVKTLIVFDSLDIVKKLRNNKKYFDIGSIKKEEIEGLEEEINVFFLGDE